MKLIPRYLQELLRIRSSYITAPVITMIGMDAFRLENNYHLIAFSTNRITLKHQEGEIEIIGEALSITSMYPEEISIHGKIEQIRLQKGSKKEDI